MRAGLSLEEIGSVLDGPLGSTYTIGVAGKENTHLSLAELYRGKPLVLSYELFPPKTDKGMDALADHLKILLKFGPDYVTCTYGAGGSGQGKTLATLALVQSLTDIPVASHLTCVGASVDDLRSYLREAIGQGVSHIVALRGDAPKDDDSFKAVDGGLRYGNELVSLIHDEFPELGIVVGGYPETHPEAPSPEADLENLKRKVDCGADVVTTQLFYDNDDFYRFRDKCVGLGIDIPIVPGVLPITSAAQIRRITSMCGAKLPDTLANDLDACGDDADAQFDVGINHAKRQVDDLVKAGVPGVHFYVLNQSRATSSVLEDLHLGKN